MVVFYTAILVNAIWTYIAGNHTFYKWQLEAHINIKKVGIILRTAYTNTSAIFYDQSVDETGSNYGIVFSISNISAILTLDVNDPTST